MTLFYATVALLAAAMPVDARAAGNAAAEEWYGGEYRSCDGTTLEIVECVMAIHERWDKRLNAAYGRTLEGLSPARKKDLRDVQRKWIAFRDANCGFYAGGEGTIARIEAATCMMVLTRERTQELEMGLEP